MQTHPRASARLPLAARTLPCRPHPLLVGGPLEVLLQRADLLYPRLLDVELALQRGGAGELCVLDVHQRRLHAGGGAGAGSVRHWRRRS